MKGIFGEGMSSYKEKNALRKCHRGVMGDQSCSASDAEVATEPNRLYK